MSPELRVKPVKWYRVPRYPSHLDPDPTLFPQRVPYPAKQRFLTAIASVGIATTMASCSNDDSAAATEPRGAPRTSAESNTGTSGSGAANPFRIEISGLPHRTSPYGTGVPNYIDADLARRVIEQTFREAGYHLQAERRIESDGVSFIADGYDESKNIGYVFAGWDNLEDDALIRWWVPAAKAGDTNAAIASLLQVVADQKNASQLVAEIEAAKALPDPARREVALRGILGRYRRDKISLDEMKKLEARAPRTKRFVAVISQYDGRFAQFGGLAISLRDRVAIDRIPDPAKRDAALRKLQERAARVVIERLEQSVREYIKWARSQGGQ